MMESRQPTSEEAKVILIGGWLARYAEVFPMYGRTLEDTPEKFETFLLALQDLDVDTIAWAFTECLKHCKEFPTPGDVRERVNLREKTIDRFESEKAWENLRWICKTFYLGPESGIQGISISKDAVLTPRTEELTIREEYRDGFMLKPKPFDRRTTYAIDAVGGLARIASLTADKEHDFVKRDFLKAHQYHNETGGLLGPSREEAKAFIGDLQKALT